MNKGAPIPAAALDHEIVTDHVTNNAFRFGEKGFETIPARNENKKVASEYYCPKPRINEKEEFDPESAAAKYYMKLHRKRFKNRRRYQRDLERRAKEIEQRARQRP